MKHPIIWIILFLWATALGTLAVFLEGDLPDASQVIEPAAAEGVTP